MVREFVKEDSDNQSVGTFSTVVDPNFASSRVVNDQIIDAFIESSDMKYLHTSEKTPWFEMFSITLSTLLAKMVKQVIRLFLYLL